MSDTVSTDPITKEQREDALLDLPFAIALSAERRWQKKKWGDDHDDDHMPADWGLMVLRYGGRLGEALEGCLYGPFVDDSVEYMQVVRAEAIKLAAVCKALTERLDRRIAEKLDALGDSD